MKGTWSRPIEKKSRLKWIASNRRETIDKRSKLPAKLTWIRDAIQVIQKSAAIPRNIDHKANALLMSIMERMDVSPKRVG